MNWTMPVDCFVAVPPVELAAVERWPIHLIVQLTRPNPKDFSGFFCSVERGFFCVCCEEEREREKLM